MSTLFVCGEECLHLNVNNDSGYGNWNYSGVENLRIVLK